MLQLQWAHNSVGDTSKRKVALKKRSNNNELLVQAILKETHTELEQN